MVRPCPKVVANGSHQDTDPQDLRAGSGRSILHSWKGFVAGRNIAKHTQALRLIEKHNPHDHISCLILLSGNKWISKCNSQESLRKAIFKACALKHTCWNLLRGFKASRAAPSYCCPNTITHTFAFQMLNTKVHPEWFKLLFFFPQTLRVIFIKDTLEGNPNQPADIPSRWADYCHKLFSQFKVIFAPCSEIPASLTEFGLTVSFYNIYCLHFGGLSFTEGAK